MKKSNNALKVLLVSAVLAVSAWLGAGCDGDQRTNVQQSNYLLDAESFDLAAVVTLIRDGHVTDASTLQERINDRNSGINAVDTDHDQQVDFIRGVETHANDARSYEFVAHPSGNPNGDTVTVATARFTRENGSYVVNAGYPNYVYGYDNHYYHHVLHDAAFLTWAYAYHPVYVMPFSSFHYVPYRVYAPSVLMSTRNAYRTQYRVSPVAAIARPANTPIMRSGGYQVPSSLRSRMVSAPANSRLAARSGTVTPFSASSPNVNARRATGVGSSSGSSGSWFRPSSSARSTPTASAPPRSSTGSWFRSSSGLGSSSSRSGGSSRGFGGGSIGRRR